MSLSRDSSAEIVTPKGITNPCYKPPNTVPFVLADPDTEPSSSDSSSSDPSNSSDGDYYKKDDVQKSTKINA